ncbi:MAG: ABC transporter substrate-binding protein [Synergistaceae bacterium]|nr:ABC transporter substrate-binding protein [Synergistaceae bacterium]
MKKMLCSLCAFAMLLTVVSIPSFAASPEPIKIGMHLGITGVNAAVGVPGSRGAQMAVDEINAAGGVLGRPLQLIVYDDQSKPEEAVKSVTKLIQVDDADVIVGSFNSGNIMAVGEMVEQAGIPYFGVSATPTWMEQGWTYIFRSMLNANYMSRQVLSSCKDFGFKTMMIWNTQDDYGKNGLRNIPVFMKEIGLEFADSVSSKAGDTDFTGQCNVVVRSNPDCIYLVMPDTEMPPIVKQLRAYGYEGWIVAEQGLANKMVRDIAGDAYYNILFSCAFTIPDKPDDETDFEDLREFYKNYVAKYGEMPTADCFARTWDAVHLFKIAMEKANTADGTAVRDAINNISEYDGLFGNYDFVGNKGEGLTQTNTFVVQDKAFVLLEDYLAKNGKK